MAKAKQSESQSDAKQSETAPVSSEINLPLEIARRTGEGLSVVAKKIADYKDDAKLRELAAQRNYDLIIDLLNPANKA